MSIEIEKYLLDVEKPGRYIGNEVNMYKKELEKVDVRFAFAFPDIYDIGMSHLGMHILYNLLNEMNGVYCERVFAPWKDMESVLRDNDLPLFTLETKSPLAEFDFIGFTLQYEMSYTNILNMIDMAKIPVLAAERNETHPMIIAGGPCAFNPETLANIVDVFFIGDGEEVLPKVMDIYKTFKLDGKTRFEFYEEIVKLEGIYIPSFYEVTYNEDYTIKSFLPKKDEYPKTIKKAMVKDLDKAYFPEKVLVPYVEVVHDRAIVEVFRGCTRGCRFCQAGMQYRPVRERSVSTIKNKVLEILNNTGFDELSLSSLSTSDYSCIEDLVTVLIRELRHLNTSISLPSLRLDNFSFDVLEEIQKIRKTGLTFAPEAGSQRLRNAINKGITETDIIETTEEAFKMGWSSVKLYFMMGLPTETTEDIEAIKELSFKIKDLYYEIPREERKGMLKISTSVACFVPKPFTPFQWHGQDTIDEFNEKQIVLRRILKDPKISLSTHDADISFLEAVIARGDRRVADVIYKAWQNGCKFDGWSNFFKMDAWMESFKELNVDPSFYANRDRSYEEILPWDFIDAGISKEFLISENEKCKNEVLTPDCRTGCAGCGITKTFGSGVCNVKNKG